MIHYSHCPVCGSENISKALSAKDYTVSGEHFEIWHCANCTARFTQDVPDADGIAPYYKAEAYVSHTDSKRGFINRAYHMVRNRTLQSKKELLQSECALQKGSVLDVGSGTGAFLSTMKQAGWKALGLEPDADARRKALELYGVALLPSHEIYTLSEKFDAVTLWHVLEHVHDLQGYVAQLHKLLSNKGKLFIAVPNYTSNDAENYGEFWAAYDVPRHLYHFSPKSMQQLFTQNGFKLSKMLPMVFDSYYVSMLSEKYKKGGSQNLIAAMVSGYRSNKKAAKSVERSSSVIYVFEKNI